MAQDDNKVKSLEEYLQELIDVLKSIDSTLESLLGISSNLSEIEGAIRGWEKRD